MNTQQIENLLRADCKLSTIFEGVFAADMIPVVCESVTALVANLDRSNSSGSHWVCMYIQNGKGEYFDSYGLAPMLDEFTDFLNTNCYQSWTYNRQELQSLDSEVCGHYCIWFLSERARGLSMQDIVSKFSSSDTKTNDRVVKQQVETRFGGIAAGIQQQQFYTLARKYVVQCCCARVKCSV